MAEVTAEDREQQVKDREAYEEEREHQEERREEAVKRVRITRARILKGIAFREQFDTPELGEGTYIEMRPLTDNEFFEMQKAILGDMSRRSIDKDLKAADIVEYEKRGKYLALSYALSINKEKWNLKEIGKMPPGLPEKLFNRLAEISGFPRPSTSESLPKKTSSSTKK